MARRHKYICRHEAAHAVVGVYLGLDIGAVYIGTREGTEVGGCVYHALARSQKLQIGVMLSAGTVSDRITRAGKMCDEGDRRLILGCGWGPHDFPVLEATARALLRGPLARPWEVCTNELLAGDLTGRNVRQIVRGVR